MSDLTSSTAQAVRQHLRQRGLSQTAAALALGLSQQAVSDRLTGRTPFTLADLERLAVLLGVPVSELLQPRSCQPLGETA